MTAQPLRQETAPQSADDAIAMAMEQGRDDHESAEILFSLLRGSHALLVSFAQGWSLQAIRETKTAGNRLLWKQEAASADHLTSLSEFRAARASFIREGDDLTCYRLASGTLLRDAADEDLARQEVIHGQAVRGHATKQRWFRSIRKELAASGKQRVGEALSAERLRELRDQAEQKS